MPLTEVKIKNAKAKEKPYKLADEKGLYLLVNPNGSKLWKHKYRYDSKEKKLSFGPHPEVSFAEARRKRDDAKRLLADDIDPVKPPNFGEFRPVDF